MWRPVRFALIWLLAFALPLQGVAAATMFACLDDAQSEASQACEHPQGHSESLLSQGSGTSVQQDMDVDHGHTGKPTSAGNKVHKCSSCGSCCLAAVAPPRLLAFGTIDLPERFAPLQSSTLAAYVTEGPERPPRRFFA